MKILYFRSIFLILLGLGNNPTSDGSCYFEHGLNKVLALVLGPHEPEYRKQTDFSSDQGSIKVQFMNSPFSGIERKKRRQGDRRVLEMERIIQEIFETSIHLELFPRSEITLVVHILETDGSTLCSAVNALSLALMDAGVPMKDIVCACSAGFVRDRLVCDLNQSEQNQGGAFLPLTSLYRTGSVVSLQLQSRLSPSALDQLMKTAQKGCEAVGRLMEEGVKNHMANRLGPRSADSEVVPQLAEETENSISDSES